MKHITIKRAEQADVDAIMQLMQEAVDTVKVSDWFLPDNRQYIEEHISDRGFTLKALSSNNEILGFFIVDLPGESKHNLGYDLNYDDHKIHKVAHMDYAVVTSKARGLGLQRRFFKEAEKQLEDTIYEYFLGTVHPIISTAEQTLSKQVTGKQDKCQNMVVCNVSSWKRRNDYE